MMKSLTIPELNEANAQLTGYIFSVNGSSHFQRGEKVLSVQLTKTRGRFQAWSTSGALLWSGTDVAEFVKAFWFAKKKEATP